MRSDVLSSLHLAEQFLRIAADAEVMDLGDLDDAFRIHDERAAQCETFLFDQHAEVAADGVSRITQHHILDLLDGVRSVMPRLVREMGIGRHAVDFDAQLLQLWVHVREIAQLGRADEGEVRGIEKEDRPLALEVRVRYRHELAVVICGRLERLDGRIDH